MARTSRGGPYRNRVSRPQQGPLKKRRYWNGGLLQAVILVGGEGTRLRPLTYGTPKPMVPLFGVPFLERTISRLSAAGVGEVILASGYMPEAISDHFGDGSRFGTSVKYVVETSPLGTAGALRNVASHITGRFFVLNGDVLTSLDLRELIAFHDLHGGIGVLHSIGVEDPSAFGCIVHDASGLISAFIEKPPRDEAKSSDINAGTYLLEASVLDAIPIGRSVSIERETFPELIAAGEKLYTFVTTDYWLDVGRPAQYMQAHDDVLDGKLALELGASSRTASGTMWTAGDAGLPANVRPPSFLGAGATIAADAVVGPYAVLGAGCRIGSGAEVRRSILWDGVSIGEHARVSGSILAHDVNVGRDAVVSTGAVIGHGVSVAAGVVLPDDARLALDEIETGAVLGR
jgi:NDP-sugar pyrophosphorylase family protein